MKRILPVSALFVLCAAVGVSVGGDKKKEIPGQKVERPAEHKVLESLVGAFDADVKVYFPDPTKPTSSKGVMTRKMILNDNFLQESFLGEFFGNKFQGLGIVGFDTVKKKFTTTWCDSMSTTMMVMEGTYDADKKTLVMVGEDVEPNSKKKMKARDVLKIHSADSQSFEMFRQPEGEKSELKIMEITFNRRKDK